MKINNHPSFSNNVSENAIQTSVEKTKISSDTVSLQAVFQKYLEHSEEYEKELNGHLLTWGCFR